MRQLVARLLENMKVLDRQVKELEAQIKAWHLGSELSRKLEKIPGIGALAASALVASIADARSFKNGRQLAAWLGLVPKQDSSGGKHKLLGMSKRGDSYLRTLLIHGRALGDRSGAEEGQADRLAIRIASPTSSKRCRSRTGQQECAHDLGSARSRARIPT